MKLLLDEDSSGRLLVRRLKAEGHDVQTVADAGLTGQLDPVVFAQARASGRVPLTRNTRDFLILHQTGAAHAGILAEYQDDDLVKNMKSEQIVAAIGKIEASGWDLQGEFVSVNAWR